MVLVLHEKLIPSYRKVQQPSQQTIIGVGQFTITHKLNHKIARKVPLDKSYIYSSEAVKVEGRIYGRLGKHKRIARCISWSDDFVDLRYECNGDLEFYLKQTPLTTSHRARCRIARQAVEAVVFIHGKDVIHSDLSARQFLVDRMSNVRLSDFRGSSLQGSEAIVMENATHFLPRNEDSPNTIQSDLFALGSTVYEVFLGKKPYEGIDGEEVQRLFSEKVFPVLDGVGDRGCERVVRKCWMCEYERAENVFEDVPSVSWFERVFGRVQRSFLGLS